MKTVDYYQKQLMHVLNKEPADFGYPGEILDRCATNFPEEAAVVADAFLTVLDHGWMQNLEAYQNAFNTDQIDVFADLFETYQGLTLKSVLKKQTFDFCEELVKDKEGYHWLVNYVIRFWEDFSGQQKTGYTNAVISNIHLLYGAKEDLSSISSQLQKMIRSGILSENALSKENRKFLKLLTKMTENVLGDKEIQDLVAQFGYASVLDARWANTKNISSDTAGRESKAAFLYLKEALFGSVKLSETDMMHVSTWINKKLDRAINQQHDMIAALCMEQFTEQSANVEFALKFLDAKNNILWHMTRKLPLKGSIYNSFSPETKKQMITAYFTYDPLVCDPMSESKAELYLNEFRTLYPGDPEMIAGLGACATKLFMNGLLPEKDLDYLSAYETEHLSNTAFETPSDQSLKIIGALADRLRVSRMDTTTEMKRYYAVTGPNLSDENIKAMYDLKEAYIYKSAPQQYVCFLESVLLEDAGKEQIHSKEEWREIADELRSFLGENRYDRLLKALLSEREYEIRQKQLEEQQKQTELSQIKENIRSAQTIADIDWYRIQKDQSGESAHAAFQRVVTDFMDTCSANVRDIFLKYYFRDIISETECFDFLRAYKQKLNKGEQS